ncbi:hypothetical protein ACK8P5_26100 (plasmid) [Paenibacillus sp. EC2-1]|uniref:hypothetical protein n=1 Tax=Paenibacillus sp. EC2-1 TaxID=3388665 RepID=UPI003BEF2793
MKNKKINKVAKTLGLRDNVDVPLSPNALDLTEIDRDVYHDCVERYPAMKDNLEMGLNEYAPFDHLSEDIFNSLFKYNAKLRDEDEVKSYSQFNYQIMEEMLESDEYEKLRKNTRFDLMSSAIGTEVLQQKSLDKITHFKEQLAKQRKTGQPQDGADAGELIEQMNRAKQMSGSIDDFVGGIPGGVDGMTPDQAKELANMQRQLRDMESDIDKNLLGQKQFVGEMTDAIDDAASETATIVGDVRNVVMQWGLESGQSGRRISLEKRRKAIERVRRSSRLKNLTDLIGRFKKLAMSKKKQKVKDGYSVHDVTTGDRLEDIIPSEWAKLSHPVMRKDFYKRFTEKQLLQYKKQDVKSRGRGPVVVCHDKSYSMSDHGKDDWATALTLATLEVAQKDGRNFAYIPYNSDVMLETVKDIPAGELDPDDILDIAELAVHGGTSFEEPLEKAVEFISSNQYSKGDILFITDGDAGVSDKFLQEFAKIKEDKKFFVHTVLINIGASGASDGTVKRFSDHITTISSVADLDDANANNIFRMIEDSADIQDAAAAAAELNDDSDAGDMV